MVKWSKIALIFVALTGCKSAPVRHIAESPSVSVGNEGQVEIKGDSQVAPNVNTAKTGSKITIPEGSRFEFNEKLGVMTLVLSKASDLVVNRAETSVQGPVAFTPDKGPTIGEEKAAQADYWTTLGLRVGMALGAAVAIFGLVRSWDLVMYGGAAVSGACLFGLFVQKHPVLMIVIGIGAALAVVGPIIWHTKLKKTSANANG
jgi:hypothetical protein